MIFFCLTNEHTVIKTKRLGRRGGELELNKNSPIIGAVPDWRRVQTLRRRRWRNSLRRKGPWYERDLQRLFETTVDSAGIFVGYFSVSQTNNLRLNSPGAFKDSLKAESNLCIGRGATTFSRVCQIKPLAFSAGGSLWGWIQTVGCLHPSLQ